MVEAGKVTELTIVSPKEPTKQVRGKILDEDGNPLANVNVTMRGRSSPGVGGRSVGLYETLKTDENGEIVFAVYEAGRHDLTISADGFEPARVEGVIVGDERVAPEFTVKLKRAKGIEVKGDVEVKAISAKKKPLSKVWVVPIKKQGEDYWEWDWQFERGQFTDKEGKVRFTNLPAGDYIFVGLPPSDNLPIAQSQTVSIAKPGAIAATILFPTPGRIIGKLVDEKGNPIVGEAVGIWREEGIEEFRGFSSFREDDITRHDGSFSFEALPEGTYTFSTSVGFSMGLGTTGQRVFVKSGETVKATVRVQTVTPTASIVGEVIDNKGNPVKGATVSVNSEPMMKTFTDENGRFEFNELPAIRYGETATYFVTVTKQGFAMRSETVKVEEGKKIEVRLMLELGAVIEGQLLDEKGEPIGGMPVYAVPLELACAG
ncbi:MAG: carboxypeptidase regulatory-like domain-containing protein [Armatimonadota bacterium]